MLLQGIRDLLVWPEEAALALGNRKNLRAVAWLFVLALKASRWRTRLNLDRPLLPLDPAPRLSRDLAEPKEPRRVRDEEQG